MAAETTPKIPGLGLDDFLRHSASGAFLLLTIHHLNPLAFVLTGENGAMSGEMVALIVAMAFPLGALVYSVHRAVVHPFFERLLTLMIVRGRLRLDRTELRTWQGFSVAPTEAEMFFFWARWDRLNRSPKIHDYMTRAASQMHFLYTVSLAYALGCIAVGVMIGTERLKWDGWSTVAIAIFLIAFIDNYRLSSIEINRVRARYDGTEGEHGREMPGGWRPVRLVPQRHLWLDLPEIVWRALVRTTRRLTKKPPPA